MSSYSEYDSGESYICQLCNISSSDAGFINDDHLCNYCHEISLGQHKQCPKCKEVKHITLFATPDLCKC